MGHGSAAKNHVWRNARESGARGVQIYCSDYHCSHYIAASADLGRITLGCPILSRVSSARLVASAERTSSRIFNKRGALARGLLFPTSFAPTDGRNRDNIA